MEKRAKIELVIEQLEERIAPGVTLKANNGWGNGAEGINNGSDEGGTEDSKLSEQGGGGGANTNTNHTQR